MDNHYIPRTLWYKKRDANNQEETIEISEDQLLLETRPLIVLGEAGMGKTELMKRLANRAGYTHCTAKRLIQRKDPTTLFQASSTLVIDALDEAASKHDGDAISEVLEKFELLDFPRFVLSCRVAEWQSRTAISTIKTGHYTQEPLEVHLKPFSESDIRSFLTNRLGADRAIEVHTHFEQLGFIEWLGNPQTLDLICAVASKGTLPQTRAELFKMATEKLAEEHNDEKTITQKPVAKLLSAAGAACAALILCGKQSIVRKPHAQLEEDELLLQDMEQLPHGADIASALNTKLFIAQGPDQFGYIHRRIGEYLAAKWLAHQADTDRKRRRLLAMFQYLGMVPASLRGLYAWLAHDPHLAQQVIAFDPLAVIEYGETDVLSAHQARLLLQALERITEANSQQWHLRSFKARCFAQAGLKDEVLRWLTNKDPNMVWLRVLVIESLEDSPMAKELHQPLLSIALDTHEVYVARSAACDCLAHYLNSAESRALLAQLSSLADEDSLRLALDFSYHQGFEKFDASALANICLLFAETKSSMGGKFFYVQHSLPNNLLPNFLDTFTAGIAQIEKKHDFELTYDIKILAFALIAKAIDTQQPKAAQVLQWLSAIEDFQFSGGEEIKKLNVALLRAPELRQEILRTVLVTQSTNDTLHQQYVKLLHYPSALHPIESDLIDLLKAMPTSDERWQALVLLTTHDQENGAAIRQVAQKFVCGNPAGQEWLEKLTAPRPKHAWEIKQEAYAAKRKAQQAAERKQRIAWHAEHLEALKTGRWEACHKAAAIYVFGQYGESHKDIFPIQRLQDALSEELAQAALKGFEAHLHQALTSPTLNDIAQGYAKHTKYQVSYIVIAGLLERLRNDLEIADLSDERILSAFFFLQSGHFDEHIGVKTAALNACIHKELLQRNLLEKGLRLFYEPQLIANVEHVSNLHALLHEEVFAEINTSLVQEWLQRFPDLRPDTEKQFIDHLIRVRAMEALHELSLQQPIPHPVPVQHRRWEAIRFLTDFSPATKRLEAHAIDAELIWELRDRSQHGYYASYEKPLIWSTTQYAWAFQKFRVLWPSTPRPYGTSSGSQNPWQATEYLRFIAQQLANTTTPEAIAALQALRNAPKDGYTELLQSLCAEQLRKLCEQNYVPASLDALHSIANDTAPKSIQDLQAWVLDELGVVQTKIRANATNSWLRFFEKDSDSGTGALKPLSEESCRDYLIELLQQGAPEITYTPEKQAALGKRVDISCRCGALDLPIEIKGQWHPDVWTAADTQLVRQYTTDWQAHDHGIYLVLWFGKQQGSKKLKSLGTGQPVPATADEMQSLLTTRSVAVQSGKVKVVVLDITQPAATQLAAGTHQPQRQAAI